MAVADRRPGHRGLGLGEVGTEQVGAGPGGREQRIAGDVDRDEPTAGPDERDELVMGVSGSSRGRTPADRHDRARGELGRHRVEHATPIGGVEWRPGFVDHRRPARPLEDDGGAADLAGDRDRGDVEMFAGEQTGGETTELAGERSDQPRRHAERGGRPADVDRLATGCDGHVDCSQDLTGGERVEPYGPIDRLVEADDQHCVPLAAARRRVNGAA